MCWVYTKQQATDSHSIPELNEAKILCTARHSRLPHLDKMKCKACGTERITVSYQARAADEASRVVETCASCPLDPTRLSVSMPPSPRHRRFVSLPPRPRASVYTNSDGWVSTTRHYLSYTAPPGTKKFDALAYSRSLGTVYPIVDVSTGHTDLGDLSTEGPLRGQVCVERTRRKIMPHVDLVQVCVYEPLGCLDRVSLSFTGTVAEARHEDGLLFSVHKRVTSDDCVMSVEYKVYIDNSGYSALSAATEHIITHAWEWEGAYKCFQGSMVSSALNYCPRAWDVASHEQAGHVYTAKIDGERQFVFVQWQACMVFRKGGPMPLVGVCLLEHPLVLTRPVILDIEATATHGNFLIDMLSKVDGSPPPETRNIAWTLREFCALRPLMSPFCVGVRQYFSDLAKATEQSESTSCPTDGVISIPLTSTSSKKLKSAKAIELKLGDDNKLLTDDGHTLGTLPVGLVTAEKGDTVEIRVTRVPRSKRLQVHSAFVRVDKLRANSTEAVHNILASFSKVKMTEETLRRNALLWCNSLRRRLFREALSGSGEKRIVLDIGSGTGQAIDSMPSDDTVSYILVEPDEMRCRQLAKRVGVLNISTEPSQLISKIKALKSRSIKYCIICCTLEALLEDDALCSALAPELRAVTSFFSAQYVAPSLYTIASNWDVRILGCAYLYDGVGVGGYLVDTLGVVMKRENNDTCMVRWGGDKIYTEPYTEKSTYLTFSSVTRARDLHEHPEGYGKEEVEKICDKIWVIDTQPT